MKNEAKIIYVLFAYLIYMLVSVYLFIWTTSGWTGMGVFTYSVGLTIITFSFFLITSIIAFKKGKRVTIVPVKAVYLLFFVQFLFITFNLGDGGDAPGQFFFYERYFNAISGYSTIPKIPFSEFISSVIVYLYIFNLAYVLIMIIKSFRPQQNSILTAPSPTLAD